MHMPKPCIKGGYICVKLTHNVYERGVEVCKKNFHGRLVMTKGDKLLMSYDLILMLQIIWKDMGQWRLISLCRGFYEFHFATHDDKLKAWSLGSYNLKPGLLRLSKWEPYFNPFTQK
jgi:hypothetical protein